MMLPLRATTCAAQAPIPREAPVMSAQRSGVPVVIFDSGLKGGEIVSFVATDNDKGGELALKEISRRKPIPKNRVEPPIEQAVIEMAIENPAFGQVRVANELTKRGQFVSPTGVRSVWVRNDLQTFARRLKALEARLAQNAGRSAGLRHSTCRRGPRRRASIAR